MSLLFTPTTEEIFNFINKKFLYNFHWQCVPANLQNKALDEFIKKNIDPIFERIKKEILNENLLEPKGVYDFFPCNKKNDSIIIYNECGKEIERFNFPRTKTCLADIFLPEEAGKDSIYFFAVTAGSKLSIKEKTLKTSGRYEDLLYFHGMGVSFAEAMAECLNQKLAKDQQRFSFGYPSCPDLSEQKKIFKLLDPAKAGIKLTSTYMMEPEQSVSGFFKI